MCGGGRGAGGLEWSEKREEEMYEQSMRKGRMGIE